MSPRLARAAAVAALVLATLSPAAHASTWEAPVTVAPGATQNATSPVVAADAAGNLTAVWAGANSGLLGVYTATRAAAAATWTAPVLIGKTDFRARDLRLAVNASGQAAVAWTDVFDGQFIEEPEQRIKTATRPANGSWSTASVVRWTTRPEAGGTPVVEDIVDLTIEHDVTIEPGGRLVGLWMRGFEGYFGGVERTAAGGPTEVAAPAGVVGSTYPDAFDIGIDSAGTATVVFVGADGQSIQTATHPAGGQWTAPKEIDRYSPAGSAGIATMANPDLAVAPNGRAVATWLQLGLDPATDGANLRAARRDLAGSWGPTGVVQSRDGRESIFSTDVGIDEGGRSTLVYDFLHADDAGETLQAWYEVRSSTAPNGGGWSAPEARSTRRQVADIADLQPYGLGVQVAPAGQTVAQWAYAGELSVTARTASGAWETATTLATGVEYDAQNRYRPLNGVIASSGRATVVYTGGTSLFSRSANLPVPVFPADPPPGTGSPTDPGPQDPGPKPVDQKPADPTPQDSAPSGQRPTTETPKTPVATTPTKTVAPSKLVVSLYVLPSGKKCPVIAAATVDGVRTNLKVAKTKLRKKLACKVSGTVVLKTTVKPGTLVNVLITAKGIKRKAVKLPAAA